MSLVADASPSPKTLGKRLYKSGGFNSCSLPCNFKHPKSDALRSFPVNFGAVPVLTALSDLTHPKPDATTASALDCSAADCGKSPSNVKCSKVDLVRDLPEHCRPFVSGINGRKSECFGNVENPGCSDGAKCEVAIPAVPLRSVPSANVKLVPEKSVPSHGKDDDVGQRLSKNTKNMVHHQEDSWERESEKLAAVIAEAKEYINLLDVKYSTPPEFPAMEGILPQSRESKATVIQEKRPREKDLSEFVMLQNLDESLSGKRMKFIFSKGDCGEKAFGMETKWEDDEEDVCVLSPAEWNMSKLKGGGAKVSIGKTEKKLENWNSPKSSRKCQNMVESQGIRNFDLVDLWSVGTKSHQQFETVSDCESTETKCGEGHQEHSFMDLDEEREQDQLLEMSPIDDENAIVMYPDVSTEAAVSCKNEYKYCENHKELINLQIGQHEQPKGRKVMEALKLFEEQYVKVLQEHKSELKEGKCRRYPYMEALNRVKAMGMCIFPEKPFGHIPGIEIGDEFRFRAELIVVGLHCQFISGIDYVDLGGMKYATSVVNSGRYENKAKAPDILIYSGQGGNPKIADNAVDQKLERGNLALKNSMEMGFPIRVIYKRKNLTASKTLGMSNDRNFVYVYDGLYKVNKCQKVREDQTHKLVFKFELHRLPGQPRTRETSAKSGKPLKCKEVCVQDDVSRGKEKFPVRAVNGVDNDLPLPFTYITNIVYPRWYQRIEPSGCNCTNGCSDSRKCPCVLKNGGEIPFNENGAILRAKPIVHECGPSCKCPPSCMNRVSQHGPRYQLEIFKTKSRGWGVRSRNYISCGSFICEYVGELLRDKEAEQRVGNDEYLFDICESDDEGGHEEFEGFLDSKLKKEGSTLDAATCGNIGRFINHSCSPNLYAQEVLYDHDDKRIPHIMFFATKSVPPLQELTYDYNYKMDRVRDVNGNIKTKACYCGSPKCTGRMY